MCRVLAVNEEEDIIVPIASLEGELSVIVNETHSWTDSHLGYLVAHLWMCSSFDAILNEMMSPDLGTTDKLGPQEIEILLCSFMQL